MKDHLDLPEWQRRGFDWTWKEGGGLEVVNRMPGAFPLIMIQLCTVRLMLKDSFDLGVRFHPTQQRPAVFKGDTVVMKTNKNTDIFY